MKERYRNMMEQAILSEQAKAAFEEKLDSVRPVKRTTRVLRTVLIAACACLVLVGGAFAVKGYIGSVDVEIHKGHHTFTADGEEWISDGYKLTTEGKRYYPMSAFSEEVNQLDGTITAETNRKYFEDWNQMEKFLGIDVINNPVLESCSKEYLYDRVLDVAPHCVLLLRADDEGKMLEGLSIAYYIADSGTRADGTEYEVMIEIRTEMLTERYSANSGLSGVYYYEGTNFEIIEYTSPNGIEADIVWVDTNPEDYADENAKIKDHYDVTFILNGVTCTVRCYASDEEKSESLVILKNVLDAFEF